MQKIGIHDPVLTPADHALVEACLRSNWLSARGAEVRKFETAAQEFFGVPVAPLATVNGSSALVLALRAAGVKSGDQVLCSDYGFVATANAARRLGAEPILLGPENPAFPVITRAQLEKFFAEHVDAAGRYLPTGRPVRAVLYNEPYGLAPHGFAELVAWLEARGVPLIEDASQAFGRNWEGRALGTFGAFGVFSLNGNKTLTTGAGGLLFGGEGLASARRLSAQARSDHFDFFYDEVAYNFDLANPLAALGLGQLGRMPETLRRKTAIRKTYRERLAPRFRLLDGGNDYPAWLNVALTERPFPREQARALAARLHDHGIQIRPAFPPVSRNEHYRSAARHGTEGADYLFHHGLCLPSGAGLTDTEVERIAALFLQESGSLGLG